MPNFTPVDFNPFHEGREIEKLTFTNEPQREIWLSCVIGGDEANLSYNESASLKINGDLNVAALRRAVDELVLRHEALRSVISANGETLIIYKNLPVDFDLVDLSGFDATERRKKYADFLKQVANTPMHLYDGPLFKVFLHKTDTREYYFTILKHHIIGDGWSTGIILEDLSKMYNAYSSGADILFEPATQISDYASEQARLKATPAYRETEDFWLRQYKDDVPVVDLPTDRPRPSPRSYKGDRIDRPLSKEMVAELKKIGAKTGASLVTTLLAAFEVFLFEETNQADLVVGLPASGQAASGLTNVVGHCVNLLPLKTHIDAGQPFADYLKKRKKEVLDAYDHQRFTFGELIRKLYIQRDASRIALVPVMFNIDAGMDNAVSFDGLDFQLISNPRAYENFEVYLNITGSKDGMILEWSYNIDLFDAATIEAFHSSYYAILEGIITDATASISALVKAAPSVTAGPILKIPEDCTLISLIEDAVTQYSGNAAVTFNGRSLTYKQLGEQTGQFAAFLAQNGIGKGDIVAISLDRSAEMLACLLAVLKVGAAYLPLDPEYPAERIGFMLKDSAAKALVTSKAYKGKYPVAPLELIVEDVWPKLSDVKVKTTWQAVNGSDLAYVLYTSGSTGTPKGVKITHRNLTNFLLSMKVAPGITEKDRMLAITSISFDIAGLELYLPLISGAEVVIADNETVKDGRLLLSALDEQRITMMQATPSSWQMILDSGWEKKYPAKILSGGEALPFELAGKLLALGDELWNMYGPTETTIWSTVKRIDGVDKQLTIGLPIANTQLYIMGETGKPLPMNQQGEIYIGGEGVADGYLNRSELTTERFVTDIFSPSSGKKLYATGDLGKMLSNGEVICLGRKDHQVKIRGHRIELGEIEMAIAKLPAVKQAVVAVFGETPVDKRIVAYVTLTEDVGTNTPTWKDKWDTLYETGANDRKGTLADKYTIDGTLLENLENSEELILQAAEWLQTSVARIKELKAKKIYEIGCGAGQVLFELAPDCERYIATDYAQAAIKNISDRINVEPEKWQQVKASPSEAGDFSAVANEHVDLVLINSVVQYFPNADYLLDVIKKAVDAVRPGGCIFIGDMQGLGSLEMYHAADHLKRAADLTTVGAFRDVVANRVRIEAELVADPMFFYSLPKLIPQITGVDVQLRKGQSLNETTKYHYDVWLYVSVPVSVVSSKKVYDWKDVKTTEQLESLLSANAGDVIEVRKILNSRTAKDRKLMQLVSKAEATAVLTGIKYEVEQTNEGVRPDVFWEAGDRFGYHAHVRWTTDGSDGLFDVVFIPVSEQLILPPASPVKGEATDIYDYVLTPGGRNEIQISGELTAQWKAGLRTSLPAYMVPDDFIALETFPLTPNAKIDRKALPKPQRRSSQADIPTRPLSANEQLVTDIWSNTLGFSGLKPTDDFFQLGGHSLLAVKVMVAIEKKTGKRLPIATLFNHSTIERLATQIADEAPERKWDALVPIKTSGKKMPLFLIHGGGLNILLFKSISEYFSDDQPLYGLQALGLNHETDIPASIPGIAKRYVADMLRMYPEGPYALAGYSLGGFLAIEVAKQLREMGKKIHFLGIMDTYAGNNTYAGDDLARAKQKIMRQFHKVPHFARIFITSPKEAFEYQFSVMQRKLQKFKKDGPIIPKDTFSEYEEGIYRKYSDALDAYVLTPYDLEVTLFRVEKRLYFVDDPRFLGWGRFALKGVKVYDVPGDHKTFLYPPYSKQFAIIMQRALDAVESVPDKQE